ncbi:MAG: RNA polymerase sigma factor [Verrucomicrobiales bacterium]
MTSAPQATTAPVSPWRHWLSENGGRLLLFARKQTRSQADAEDILQEALVKLARKVEEGSFDGGQEAWLPFLYTQIRREAIDLGRKNDRRRKREELAVEEARTLDNPMNEQWFHSEHDDETRQLLERELKNLPQKFSEVILMKIWGKRTFADIGESLGISLNTAASRYRYGLEALRRQLGTARIRGDL